MTDTPLLLHPAPRPDWLAARAEPIIDPELPIIDPHHHLWDRNGGYLLDDLLADLATGHNILSTVFLQCGYAHRADGPEAMRPVGETEFVAGVAAEAARRSCPTRVCEGIVGHADLLLGDAVAPVLEAHIAAAGGRFRGIRHITASSGFFDASVAPPPPGLMADPRFHAGFARLHGYGLGFDAWLYHPQIDELTALARMFPETSVVLDHVGGPLGVAPYAGKRHETFADWRAAMQRLAACPNVSVKLGGLAMLTTGFAFHESRPAAEFARSRGSVAPVPGDEHRAVRPAALHVRKQFSGGQGHVQLPRAVERLQARGRRLFGRREVRAVPRHGGAGVRAAPRVSSALSRSSGGFALRDRRADPVEIDWTPVVGDVRAISWAARDRRQGETMRTQIGLSLAVLFAGWSVAAAAQTPTLDQVVAGAAKEGHVTVWVQSPARPETHRALAAAFNARFKTDIKVDWVANPATTSNTRVIAEMAGGHVSVDVIGPGAAEEVQVAAKAGMVKPYPWTEVFGAAFPQIGKLESLIIPEFKGDALPYILISYGLAWNPTMVKDADLPTRMTDLADPKWRGKFGVNAFFITPLDVSSYAIGQPAALDLARKIIANEPVYGRGTPAVARAVVTGETPIGFTNSGAADASIRQHEPLKYRLFADVIPVSQLHVYVPEGAPDPNAARLFAAWLVTDGVKLADTFEPLSSPADPDNATIKMIAEQVQASGAKVASPKSVADLEAGQKLRDQITAMQTGQAK